MSETLESVLAALQKGELPDVPLTNEQLQSLHALVMEKKKREAEERRQRQITEFVKDIRTQILKAAMQGKTDLTLQSDYPLDMIKKYREDVIAQIRAAFPDITLSEDYRHPRDRTILTGLYLCWSA